MLMTQELADIESPRFLEHYVTLLNDALFRLGRSWHVTTLVAVTLETGAGRLYYASCGNQPPILLRPGDGKQYHASRLLTRYGLLGLEPELPVELESIAFGAGDELVVLSDGVDLPRSSAKAAIELSRLRKVEVREAAYLACQSARIPTDDQSLVWLRQAG
jgi:serine phosphatase RsbU (regulator of sigma subunit)